METPNDLRQLLTEAKLSVDASVFVGGSLFWQEYDVLSLAIETGVHLRAMFPEPESIWVARLVEPAGASKEDYAQRITVNASRALVFGNSAEVRWQPFPLPWWFAVVDQECVLVKPINITGRAPSIIYDTSGVVQYYSRLFESAWSLASSVDIKGEPSTSNTSAASGLRVFLCHSSTDKSLVRDLYDRLRGDGVLPWLDDVDLLPGQNWQAEIGRALREVDVVIICLSKRALDKRGFVQREIKMTLDVAMEMPPGTIYVIPARLEDCDVPESLRRWQYVDLFEEQGYSRLARALRIARRR